MSRLWPVLVAFLGLSAAAAQEVVIDGSTPGAIACAVRVAREGADVLMVTHAGEIAATEAAQAFWRADQELGKPITARAFALQLSVLICAVTGKPR